MSKSDYIIGTVGLVFFVLGMYLWWGAPCELLKDLNLTVPGRCLWQHIL